MQYRASHHVKQSSSFKFSVFGKKEIEMSTSLAAILDDDLFVEFLLVSSLLLLLPIPGLFLFVLES